MPVVVRLAIGTALPFPQCMERERNLLGGATAQKA